MSKLIILLMFTIYKIYKFEMVTNSKRMNINFNFINSQ